MTPFSLTPFSVVDSHISRRWRSCGKLWAASLLRHHWNGAIRIERSFLHPLSTVPRKELLETEFVPSFGRPTTKKPDWKTLAREHQMNAAGKLAGAAEYDWILLADADCIALRNMDHLFPGDGDLLVSQAEGVVDPGFVAVRGRRLGNFVSELQDAGGLTRVGLTKIVRSGGWRVRDFERGEVLRPSDGLPVHAGVGKFGDAVFHYAEQGRRPCGSPISRRAALFSG